MGSYEVDRGGGNPRLHIPEHEDFKTPEGTPTLGAIHLDGGATALKRPGEADTFEGMSELQKFKHLQVNTQGILADLEWRVAYTNGPHEGHAVALAHHLDSLQNAVAHVADLHANGHITDDEANALSEHLSASKSVVAKAIDLFKGRDAPTAQELKTAAAKHREDLEVTMRSLAPMALEFEGDDAKYTPANFRILRLKLRGPDGTEVAVRVAGMADPSRLIEMVHPREGEARLTTKELAKALERQGFGQLVSLDNRNNALLNLFFPRRRVMATEDYGTFSQAQFDMFYEQVMADAKNGRDVAVHCAAGLGRTGTMLASLIIRQLVERGVSDDPTELADIAIQHLRAQEGSTGILTQSGVHFETEAAPGQQDSQLLKRLNNWIAL